MKANGENRHLRQCRHRRRLASLRPAVHEGDRHARSTEVPYQGTGPALTDLVGGQVDFMCDQTTNTTGQIKAGEVKAYAITSAERNPALPDLPTTAEGGPAGSRTSASGTASTRRRARRTRSSQKLTAALQAALKDQKVDRQLRRARHDARVARIWRRRRRISERLAVADRAVEADHRGGGRAAAIVSRSGGAARPPRFASASRRGQRPCRRSLKDLLAGLVFIAFGLAFAIAALELRSRHRLPHGAGLFPAGARRHPRRCSASSIVVEGIVRGERRRRSAPSPGGRSCS